MSRIHRSLRPFIIPVINEMMTILQSYGLLRLCNPVIGCVNLPDSLTHTCNLLDMSFPACYQQITLGQLLHRPGQESIPMVNLFAIAIILMDTAQSHIRNQQRSPGCQSGITELSMNRSFF